MVGKQKVAFWLISISAIIGGISLILFFLSAGFMNHANLWLPVFFLSRLVIGIALIGILAGAAIRKSSRRSK